MATKTKKLTLSNEQIYQVHEDFGLTRRDIKKLTENQIRSIKRKMDNRDRPRAREAHARLIAVDDSGQIHPHAVNNALRQLDSARARSSDTPLKAGVPCGRSVQPRALFSAPALVPAAGISVTAWQPIGPGNIGGRTRAIIVDPSNPDNIWVGSAGGGVWNSNNAGASWEPVDDMMANLAICSMAIDPSNENIIYAGTGEGFNNVDAQRGAGIFHTDDKINWHHIAATNNPNFHYVNRIAISRNGKVMLVATSQPFSGGTADSFGIFRSEDPARSIWTKVLDSDRMSDVKFSPSDSRKAVAGGLVNGEAYFTTNGGKTWRQATHSGLWDGRVELTYAAKDSSIVYASVDINGGEIWRSEDGGKTYLKRNSLNTEGNAASFLGQQGWYDNTIWAGDMTDSDLVVVGGIDLWRSTNGGDTLKPMSNWRESASVHADHHAIVSHPDYNGSSNKTVFFGNDGGIHKASNVATAGNNATGTNGWTSLVNDYAVTQFYGCAANTKSGTIIGGTQDNGTLAFSPAGGPSGWIEIQGGDGGYCAADPQDDKLFYGEYVYLEIFRNTNGATSDDNWWENYINGKFWNQNIGIWDWKPIPFSIPDSKAQKALFIAPFILDPNNSERILAGGESLWRTNDAKTPNTNSSGPSWRAIKSSIGSGIDVSAIAVASGDSDNIWVGYTNGLVAKTTNGTALNPVWKVVGASGSNQLTPNRYCTRIVIDASDSDVVYSLFGGYTSDNIWKTVDGGVNWSSIGATLPEAPARTLAIHPRKSEFLYLGTEVGVFASEDSGATWSPTNEGPTNCAVAEFFWMDETLVCATHGRGMFTIDLSGV